MIEKYYDFKRSLEWKRGKSRCATFLLLVLPRALRPKGRILRQQYVQPRALRALDTQGCALGCRLA